MTIETSVQQIQQRLTCPVCLEPFKQPKLLPCQHTFCLTPCLTGLADRVSRRVKCPECRCVHPLPLQGVEALPNNITIQRFLDLDLRQMTNNSNSVNNSENCSHCSHKHDNYFKCVDCDKSFCVNCKPVHVNQLKVECKQSTHNLRRLLPQMSEKVGGIEQRKTVIQQNFESIKRDISSVIEKLIEDLRNREKCLHAEADVYMQSNLRTVSLEKENAEIELVTLSSFCDSVESTLNNNESALTDNEIALMKKQCKSYLQQAEMNQNTNNNGPEVFKMNLIVTDLNSLSTFISNFGSLAYNQQHPNSSRNEFVNHINNSNTAQRPTWNRPNNVAYDLFEFSANSPSSNRMNQDRFGGPSETLPSRYPPNNAQYNQREQNNQTVPPAPVPRLTRNATFVLETDNSPSPNQPTRSVDLGELYNVQRRPRAKTPLLFNIMLNDPDGNDDINSEPSTVRHDDDATTTQSPPQEPRVKYEEKKKAKLIIGKQGRDSGELIWPIDAAYNKFNHQIIIADSNNHRIQIFESDGRFVKSFGQHGRRDGQFDTISGIFADSMGNIFVSDRLNHRVQIFDRFCRFVRCIGSGQGTAPGQLNHPWGVAVSLISEIFVCDKENDRISVFHYSGRFLRSFGQHGNQPGQFDKPYYLHVTRDNRVIVSDSSNHRIQVFDTQGIFLYQFGSEGTAPGQFKHPRGVATDSEGFILVADSGNSRVQVFRSDGVYVSQFGSPGVDSGKFKGIEGLCLATNNQTNAQTEVIVCDKENHRVQVL